RLRRQLSNSRRGRGARERALSSSSLGRGRDRPVGARSRRRERDARAQAEKRLSAGLAELGGHEKGDALKALLDTAQLSDETYGSDGSVSLKLTLSTKALDVKR
ncbi:MAG TPA: hypothetical protein VII38_23365, partial [Polyangia bacterium]